ncbi:hypothetical protein BCIN_05g06920 [Botrytis cinerea B05.10]|uniref:Uncharacterized protein n=3 Tax=Botryotinia fuckeliana TaxID=40559 RepID=A0A384JIF2_BOTFB|nr:hypothetical protein BCIN_05g06920 [Botrytis cinerea B05.10]ATZ50333.1 hypothetical protein BCIN_05g06920 [Botrytis cinerea B05.10]EMR84102.1 hypothetical protein BcDW1_7250 [Botrytis cinerea BcDW1]CCD48936.1 hypothetical protein BofuT4P237000005001 [Botrytis cinerea T4]
MSSYHGDHGSKSRSKVKPVFKKLIQSEKNSLDLDRPAEEQQDGLGIFDYGAGYSSRSSHDIAYNSREGGRRGFHARSTSGTSQFSIATTGSAQRSGSFVHPFQQTPRPYTPPLGTSYQNSIRESEATNSSIALTEDEDQLRHTFRSTANLSNQANSMTGSTNPMLQQTLRIQTKLPPTSSRLGLPTSRTSPVLSPDVTSPLDTMSPTSPSIRQSMEGFRLRSRSDVDNRLRSETIQEARRKFQEKERAKEEKAAREEIRAMEKKQQKEARQIERGHRRSSASDNLPTRSKRSKSDLTIHEKSEGIFGQNYNTASIAAPPFLSEELGRGSPNRSHTAMSNTKKKTHNAWTKLMMWLKTRFMRLGKKSSKK